MESARTKYGRKFLMTTQTCKHCGTSTVTGRRCEHCGAPVNRTGTIAVVGILLIVVASAGVALWKWLPPHFPGKKTPEKKRYIRCGNHRADGGQAGVAGSWSQSRISGPGVTDRA